MTECPFTVIVDQAPLDGPFIATVPALPEVNATGATVEEAVSRAIEAGNRALAAGAMLRPREEWEKELQSPADE